MPRLPLGPYTCEEGLLYWEIPLTKGMVARVSDEDVERVAQYNWYASRESRGTKWYAIRREWAGGKRVKIRMHRFVMDMPPGMVDDMVVDHVDHDSLDNRRHKLEIITQEENMKRSQGWKKKGQKVEEPCL